MKQRFRLFNSERSRSLVIEAVMNAPAGYIVTIEPTTRTLLQNKAFHGICTELARRGIKWAGKARTIKDWKVLLISGHAVANDQPAEVVDGMEGELVNLRESTAQMPYTRMNSVLEYAYAWMASELGIVLHVKESNEPE
jgi:hypothetical protein